MTHRTLILGIFVALLFVSGCGDDTPTTNPNDVQVARTAIGDGDIGSGPFFLRAQGPAGSGLGFTLRGENLRYENDRLTAEFYAINDGDDGVLLPATLTLLTIDPDSVTVDGADNGEPGAGATFALEFAQDDLEWSVGEESLAETLAFDVDQGTSIAFVARIDVEMSDVGGSIGGTVFEDLDRDGVFDAGENGVGGITIGLSGEGVMTRAETMSDGTYRFDGLDEGVYTVTKRPARGVVPTTETSTQVLLVADGEGNVGDYLAADFGCLVRDRDDDDDRLAVGDFVEVTGRWTDDVLVAYGIETEDHEWDRDHDDDLDRHGDRDDDHGDRDDDDEWPELRGPVTDVDVDAGALSIMGIALDVDGLRLGGGGGEEICRDGDALDLVVGDRARARLAGAVESDSTVTTMYDVSRIKCWSGRMDQVHGVIEAIERDDDDRIVSITVLGVRIVRAGDMMDDDDGDDDEDDDGDDDGGDEDDGEDDDA